MKKNAVRINAVEVTETNHRLVEENAALRAAGRVAMEAAHRQMANMQKVGAMARAIRRGGMSEADLAAMASTMEQLAVHCEAAAQDHVEAMRLAAQLFGRQHEAGEDEEEWRMLALTNPVRH